MRNASDPETAPAEEDLASSVRAVDSIRIWWKRYWKYVVGWVLAVILLTIIGIGIVISRLALQFTTSFEQTAGTTIEALLEEARTGWEETSVTATDDGRYKHILLLGTDTTPARTDRPPLTDTMIILAVDLETGTIRTLSLPRDLYNEAYQTRINALYSYGQEQTPEDPTKFPTSVIQDMTGVEIHHTVVLSLRTVGQLVDQVDGITIDVQEGFSDPNFPNFGPESEENPYRTVTFEAGLQRMDGPRVLDYIRSRKAAGEQGTDEARSERQRVVIEQLVARLMQPTLWLDPIMAGSLYQLYVESFQEYISIPELVATGRVLLPVRQQLHFESHGLSIYPDDPDGVIEHPPQQAYDGQWVYIIRDQAAFETYVDRQLHE